MNAGTPARIDPVLFRRVLAQFATGVTVITVEHDDQIHGMTANTFTSVSLDPPLVLFCVAKSARMSRLVRQAGAFAVSILGATQEDAARQFAGSRRNDSDASILLERGPVAPLVQRPLAALSCITEATHDGGDHWIVVGRVVELHDQVETQARPPLVFFRSRYVHVVERDLDQTIPGETWENDAVRIYHDEWSEGEDLPIDEHDRFHWGA
jgi:3-hydroxy-9,10-secoandrosta-1,3,5(10)-triene-9,17-dione monooxygenase reductase component